MLSCSCQKTANMSIRLPYPHFVDYTPINIWKGSLSSFAQAGEERLEKEIIWLVANSSIRQQKAHIEFLWSRLQEASATGYTSFACGLRMSKYKEVCAAFHEEYLLTNLHIYVGRPNEAYR